MFCDLRKMDQEVFSVGRIKAHDGPKCLRWSWEVPRTSLHWRQIVKGGDYRRHAGNEEFVVDWPPQVLAFYESKGRIYPERFVGKEEIYWSKITSVAPSFRLKCVTTEYDSVSPTLFNTEYRCDEFLLALLTCIACPSEGDCSHSEHPNRRCHVLVLPVCEAGTELKEAICTNAKNLIVSAMDDWNIRETAWDIQSLSLLSISIDPSLALDSGYTAWIANNKQAIAEMV